MFQKQYTKDFEEWMNYFKQREKNRDVWIPFLTFNNGFSCFLHIVKRFNAALF